MGLEYLLFFCQTYYFSIPLWKLRLHACRVFSATRLFRQFSYCFAEIRDNSNSHSNSHSKGAFDWTYSGIRIRTFTSKNYTYENFDAIYIIYWRHNTKTGFQHSFQTKFSRDVTTNYAIALALAQEVLNLPPKKNLEVIPQNSVDRTSRCPKFYRWSKDCNKNVTSLVCLVSLSIYKGLIGLSLSLLAKPSCADTV